MTQYTMRDLEIARSEQSAVERRWDNYSGNNPDKFQSERKAATRRVELIESELKRAGVIPYTENELLERALDAAHPGARSKDVVEHEGKRYERRYVPAERSRRGNVLSWKGYWVELK